MIGQVFRRMKDLPAETLLGLLRMYEAAIADLRATGDVGVEGLIMRLTRHRIEVIDALSAVKPV